MRFLFIFLILILILPVISAFGVTPAQRVFSYEPDVEQKFSFEIINSEAKTVELIISAQGELNESVNLLTKSVSFTPDISSVTIEYTVKMPSKLPPGRHIAEILVIETTPQSAGETTYIGSLVGIVTKVVIDVPYPGKYIESALSITNTNDGVSFIIPVVSKGEKDIKEVKAVIGVFNSLNEKVATADTQTISLLSGQRQELNAKLDLSTLGAGNYIAIAQISYDGSMVELKKEFFVGGGGLVIKNIKIDTENFQLGGVAKFDFLLENKLNIPADNVYVLMQVFDKKGDVLSEFKSAAYDIDSYTSEEVTAFWDTQDIKKGTYEAKAFIYSEQEPIEAQLTLEVSDNEITVFGAGYVIKSGGSDKSSLVTILIIIIGVLVLLNLIWFLVLRRKIKNKVGRKTGNV